MNMKESRPWPRRDDVPEHWLVDAALLRRELQKESLHVGLHEGRLIPRLISQAHLANPVQVIMISHSIVIQILSYQGTVLVAQLLKVCPTKRRTYFEQLD